MNAFHFANRHWNIWLWCLLGMFVILGWWQIHEGNSVERFVSSFMARRLVRRPARWRDWMSLCCWLACCVCVLLAIMRPRIPGGTQTVPRFGAQIMVCLDVSKSMLAEDAAPNRLERAKADLTDMLQYLRGDQVGLIAFAGRATVVCPMTTDFGFLKLLLTNLGPHTVGRGGTQLEAPLRAAMEGFTPAGDVSRIILLITDGEDHNSFPLAAAKEAAERGIRIIAMGFGSEAGIAIEYTDPRDGTRKTVRDENNRPVVSRLDGATLREIALKTDGVYIPVGTGSLDLQSIHQQHIAPLLRDDLQVGQVKVYDELYQWFAGLGLLFLLLAVLIQSGTRAQAEPISMAALVLLATLMDPPIALAQTGAPSNGNSQGSGQAKETPQSSNASKSTENEDASYSSEPPRTTYNRASRLITTDQTQAEKLLKDAAERAGSDGTLRFYCNYNLGWLAAQRAEGSVADDPAKALEFFQESANRFQQAVRIRPEDEEARHNLEVVARRMVQVKDAIDQKSQPSLASQLDGLLNQQRELLQQQVALLESNPRIDRSDAPEDEPVVRQYRQLATRQRLIRSDLEAYADRCRETVQHNDEEIAKHAQGQNAPGPTNPPASAPANPPATPVSNEGELKRQNGQLRRLEPHLQTATQRMGQSRRDLRLREGARAYRRASHALEAMKQARDQLRQPRERLQSLIQDAHALRKLTQQLEANLASTPRPASSADSENVGWLNGTLLQESQETITARTIELRQVTEDEMNVAATVSAPGDPSIPAQHQNDDATAWADARSELHSAVEEFEKSQNFLTAEDFAEAVAAEGRAIEHLAAAAERLLDIKGLIETVHRHESLIQQWLEVVPNAADSAIGMLLKQARQTQTGNLDRTQRLIHKLEANQQQLEKEVPQGPTHAVPDPQAVSPQQQELQRLGQALEIAKRALQHMQNANGQLQHGESQSQQEQPSSDSPAAEATDVSNQPSSFFSQLRQGAARIWEPWASRLGLRTRPLPSAHGPVKLAVDELHQLRRLYFSIVEHVIDAANRQSDLRDATDQLRSEADPKRIQEALAIRQMEQTELAALGEELTQALREMAAPAAQEDQANSTPSPADEGARFGQASECVGKAAQAMHRAEDVMKKESSDLPGVVKEQDEALQQLVNAIEILQPPSNQPQDQPQSPPPGGDNPDNPPPQTDSEEDKSKEPQQAQDMGLQEVLQRVRDRDAKRHGKRMRNGSAQDSVDKDW